MREQLGEVAYITLIATVYVAFEVYANNRVLAQSNIVMNETITVVIVGCVSAAVLFLIEQAFRYYIFAGATRSPQNARTAFSNSMRPKRDDPVGNPGRSLR